MENKFNENKEEKIKWHNASLQSSRAMYQEMFLNFNDEIKSHNKSFSEALTSIGKIKSKYARDVEELSKINYNVPLLQGQLDAYEILN
jgi:hypothetical protein